MAQVKYFTQGVRGNTRMILIPLRLKLKGYKEHVALKKVFFLNNDVGKGELGATGVLETFGIPHKIRTTWMREKICTKINQVVEFGLHMYPNNTTIVKVNVIMDVTKPLSLGIHMVNKKDGINWIEFRYERLLIFYFNYGM
ncbi:hypothetical protein RYX36_012890, partial [Vicia faba]